MRKLTLNREALQELDPDQLAAVAAGWGLGISVGPPRECLSGLIRCNTADTFCEFSQGC